jgi:excisionase family DNA binding protein
MRHADPVYDDPRRILLTVNGVARYLNCSRRTVERLVARGDLQPLRVGARRRFRREELDAYLERDREPGP